MLNGLRGKLPQVILVFVLLLVVHVAVLHTETAIDSKDNQASPNKQTYLEKKGDEELAYLLVKLEKRTRQVIAGHYTRPQAGGSQDTKTYKDYLVKNLILPAAVADSIFSDVVPGATGGRAWVKMVVEDPRNPNNKGDATALEMVSELKKGAAYVERKTSAASYYGEPIVAKAGCMGCHGQPAGEPDPNFPQYNKDGWKPNEVIGGVIARVAPEE